MSAPEYVPHKFVVQLARKAGEPLARFGHPGPVTWTLPKGADIVQLRAAITHHLLIVGLRRATARSGTPVEDFAAAAGRTTDQWPRVLAGQIVMRLTDVAAVLLAGPEAAPDGRHAHALIAKQTADAKEEIGARIAAAAGNAERFWAREVQKALGSGQITAQQPLGSAGQALLGRAREALSEVLPAAVARALREHGLPENWASAPKLDVDLADQPGAVGYATADPLVSVALRHDWEDTVLRPGWAVLDGRLVLSVDSTGRDGKPSWVTVLALSPDWNGQPPEQPEAVPAWGWAWEATEAQVAWGNDRPAVSLG